MRAAKRGGGTRWGVPGSPWTRQRASSPGERGTDRQWLPAERHRGLAEECARTLAAGDQRSGAGNDDRGP